MSTPDERMRLLHDAANMLLVILNSAHELDELGDMPAVERGERVREILAAAGELNRLCTESYHRELEAVQLERLPLVERFKDWATHAAEMREAYGLDVTLTYDVSKTCAVVSSRARAQDVTRRVLQNAARAGASRVHIHYRELVEHVEVVFADDGCGMTPGELATLGLHAPHGMSGGRGIAQLRQLVIEAGGSVAWDSRKGVGTWVTIALRKAPGLAENLERSAERATDAE